VSAKRASRRIATRVTRLLQERDQSLGVRLDSVRFRNRSHVVRHVIGSYHWRRIDA